MKIAVLETQVERLLEKQKELTERVRANEKVVAAIGLFGSVAVAFIGAGYFAPSAEACSPRLDGEPTYCPDFDDVLVKPFEETITDKSFDEKFPNYYNSQWDAGRLIQKLRDWESEKNRTDPEDSINNALADMENFYGSDDTTESEELLQLSSNGDQSSIGWGYNRCYNRPWIRSLQEGEGTDSRCGHSREEDS